MSSLKIFTALAILLLSAVAAIAGPEAPALSPQIYFPEQSHLFAPAMEGGAVTHDFAIENRGASPLEITRVRVD